VTVGRSGETTGWLRKKGRIYKVGLAGGGGGGFINGRLVGTGCRSS
jgi:hypothetical protein